MEFVYGFVWNLLSSVWKSIDVCTIVRVCIILSIKSIDTWFGTLYLVYVMSLKVIYFQSIFLIDFYIKRMIYMQEYGITSPNCCAAGNSKESRNYSKRSRMWLTSTDITG